MTKSPHQYRIYANPSAAGSTAVSGPNRQYDPPLDAGIRRAVEILNRVGIETYESCEGGSGHAYPEPTIRFHGDASEGFRAVAAALQHKLPVSAIRRVWDIIDGEPSGPTWEMVFSQTS